MRPLLRGCTEHSPFYIILYIYYYIYTLLYMLSHELTSLSRTRENVRGWRALTHPNQKKKTRPAWRQMGAVLAFFFRMGPFACGGLVCSGTRLVDYSTECQQACAVSLSLPLSLSPSLLLSLALELVSWTIRRSDNRHAPASLSY